jgi:hypothetical protein
MNRARIGVAALAAALALALSVTATLRQAEPVEAAGIALDELTAGLSQPLGVVSPGDGTGRLFIVEKGGTIRIWDGTALLATPFLDISGLITEAGAPGARIPPLVRGKRLLLRRVHRCGRFCCRCAV